MRNEISRLQGLGIRATPQRLAVARCVFRSRAHPSAEEVLKAARRISPTISRASVYNTLDLFVRKGLIERRALREGRVVYDPAVEPHHHFIDERTGAIYDIPHDACRVRMLSPLPGFEIRDCQVVMRGRRTGERRARRA